MGKHISHLNFGPNEKGNISFESWGKWLRAMSLKSRLLPPFLVVGVWGGLLFIRHPKWLKNIYLPVDKKYLSTFCR